MAAMLGTSVQVLIMMMMMMIVIIVTAVPQ